MPRKATGTLVWREGVGYFGRYWITVPDELDADGKPLRKRVFESLDTMNELLAKQRLAERIAAAGGEHEASAVESFQEAAERVIEARLRTIPSARAEGSYMRTHVYQALGRVPVTEVTRADVMSVLEAVRDAGLSAQTILHVRNAISTVFKQLRREGVVSSSPVPGPDELPECLLSAIDDRPKAILSDAELLVYLATPIHVRASASAARCASAR